MEKKEKEYMPELGNILFGNSLGEFHVDRDVADELFAKFLIDLGCDMYGYAGSSIPKDMVNDRGGVTTPVFEILPYYWGDDEKEEDKPNFRYIPENIEVRWYKYPMRDAYSNIEMSKEKWEEILGKCLESIRS